MQATPPVLKDPATVSQMGLTLLPRCAPAVICPMSRADPIPVTLLALSDSGLRIGGARDHQITGSRTKGSGQGNLPT
jgi:hypothetical protein